MTDEDVLDIFRKIKTWKRNDQRAPHKPLLLLMTLARIQRGGPRLTLYTEIEPILDQLLIDFGPPWKTSAVYSFWRLKNDGGFWDIPQQSTLEQREAIHKSGDVSKGILKDIGAEAGFTKPYDTYFRNKPELVKKLAQEILETHFPETYYRPILNAIEMPDWTLTTSSKDSLFRKRILLSYEYTCSVCGYDGKIDGLTMGIEVSHFKWLAAGGAQTINNGIALCALHQKVFDLGGMTINDNYTLSVSSKIKGLSPLIETLIHKFNGAKIQLPKEESHQPNIQYLDWHRRNVFKS